MTLEVLHNRHIKEMVSTRHVRRETCKLITCKLNLLNGLIKIFVVYITLEHTVSTYQHRPTKSSFFFVFLACGFDGPSFLSGPFDYDTYSQEPSKLTVFDFKKYCLSVHRPKCKHYYIIYYISL